MTLDWLTRRPIAHRGLHDLNNAVWENTLSAFQAAINADYAIECDVHLSRDGIAMVFHDENLTRLTGAQGDIHELTATQAGALQIGGTKDRIPSLKETLSLIAGRVPVIIELKGTEDKDDGLVKAVAMELKAYSGPAAIMSFDHHLIRRFASDAPNIPAGLTAEGIRTHDLEAHFSMLAHPIDFISYNVHHLPNPFISFVKEKLNKQVITWTVQSEQEQDYSNIYADQITFEGFNPDRALA